MPSDASGPAFLCHICQCILLPHLRASRFHLSKAFIKFTNPFHAGSSISGWGWAVAAGPLCTQTAPRGSGFLTSPVGWEWRNTNHFQVICKKPLLHYALCANYFPVWAGLKSKAATIKGYFVSNPADTAAPRNHPALLNPSTVRDQTSHWKHPLQLFFTGKGKNLVWCVRSLYRSLFLPLQKFTAVYLFSEMTSPTK